MSHDRMTSLVRPLDPERLLRRPSADRWSVGEVLEHLTLMDELFLTAVEPIVRTARKDAAAPARPWSATFIGGKIAGSLEGAKPLKSPKAAVPNAPRAALREAFLAGDSRYATLLSDAAPLDWNAVRLRPPVAPWVPLKINLGDVFCLHRVHVQRHLKQIERIVARTR
ncbi:MAG: DinB family protein [Gemmatimonadaceae bacterium]